MAYSDYGAFVFCNNKRREDKEDVALFATDEETENCTLAWVESIHHGTMGDGNIRVLCHKQSCPEVYEKIEDGSIHKVDIKSLTKYRNEEEIPWWEESITLSFEYKGYKFRFVNGEPNRAEITEPDGTFWECEYDYLFGAGFED